MRPALLSRFVVLALSFPLAACGGSSSTQPPGTAQTDTGGNPFADTGAGDDASAPADTASDDSAASADTSLVDEGVADTSSADAASDDTSVVDSLVVDSLVVDSVVADTSVVDSVVVVDAADTSVVDSAPADTGPAVTNIKHVVLIVEENHTFDNYFGHWCTAPTGSNPTCNNGPSCCEAAPGTEPSGSSPIALDDSSNGGRDPDHTYACEWAEMDNGKMDHYVTGTSCPAVDLLASTSPNPGNYAVVDPKVGQTYQAWATQYALADRYFQPLVGQTSANDMYFAVARWQFKDNQYKPNCNGKGCIAPTTPTQTWSGVTTIADLITGAGHTFNVYAEGLSAMWQYPWCPALPSDCTGGIYGLSPCYYDCSDIPFEYYSQWLDKSDMKDWTDFQNDISAGTLPDFAYVKFAGYHNEQPGYNTKLTTSIEHVQTAVDAILSSPYANDTLVIVTWDEGGGYFDHVSPPGVNPIDNEPYGTRVPMLAVGRFAKKGFVSHVQMEHSSVVKFLELNFTGKTGQLGARDTNVNNLGSMLDPAETGIVVPEH